MFGSAVSGVVSSFAQKAKPLNPLKAMRILYRNVRHTNNREVVKGLLMQYGPDVALSVLLFVPVAGWALAILGYVPASIIQKRGEKLIDRLEQQNVLSEREGPLYRIARIQKLWRDSVLEDAPRQIREQFNRLIDELFPDSGADVAAARQRLKLQEGGRVFRLLNHVFETRRIYANRFAGKVVSGLNRFTRWIPVRFLRLPLTAAGMALEGGLMLLSHRQVRQRGAKMVSKVAARVV